MRANDAPLISLTLAIKNGMPMVKTAIEALQRQRYRKFELIVQDSMSTDGGVAFIRSMDGLPHVDVVSERDSSLVEGYDRAFRRCRGDLVLALACDEFLEDDALEICVDWYRQRPDAAFLYGGVHLRDVQGKLLQDFQPPDFDLLQFLALDMCPPVGGGFFNRRIVGSELHLDRSLKTCPDFELLARLALKFGDAKMVKKEGRFLNARADSVSMTFRPESYDQFIIDKGAVIERLCKHGSSAKTLGRFYPDFMCGLYTWSAKSVLALSGDDERFRRYAIAASRYRPGSEKIVDLARSNRHLELQRDNGLLRERQFVAPQIPPADARVLVGAVAISNLEITETWRSDGSTCKAESGFIEIATPAGSWSFSAMLPLTFPDANMSRYWYWIRLRVQCLAGSAGVSLYSIAENVLWHEFFVEVAAAPRDVYIEVIDRMPDAVMVRNGVTVGSSQLRIFDAAVMFAPKPPDSRR